MWGQVNGPVVPILRDVIRVSVVLRPDGAGPGRWTSPDRRGRRKGHPLMRPIARNLLLLAGTLTACGPLAGCLTLERLPYQIDPGETGYSHILGQVDQRYVYPLPLVERAMVEAMSDMKIHSVRRMLKTVKHGENDIEVVCLAGLLFDGRAIAVELEPQGEATGVRVRIDVYGDEPKSQILLSRTSVRLATLPQAVNPPFDTRTISDTALHRGMEVEGYRGAPLR
jgi:hypothetical protein